MVEAFGLTTGFKKGFFTPAFVNAAACAFEVRLFASLLAEAFTKACTRFKSGFFAPSFFNVALRTSETRVFAFPAAV